MDIYHIFADHHPDVNAHDFAHKMKANTGYKWWALPPKKGPLSQGLKLPQKQVKKV